MNPAAPSPSAAVRKAGLLLPVLRRSAESWGNHHCAGELRRAIALIEDLSSPAAAVGGEQLGDFQDKALAWDAVCVALNTVLPGWARSNNMTGLESAVAAIHKMATTPAAPVGGFVVVPREPTEEMELAAENYYEANGMTFPDWKAAYREMVGVAVAMDPVRVQHGCSCPSGDGSLRWPCEVHPTPTAQPSAKDGAGEYGADATPMPGASGFTMAVFNASDVPIGARVYATKGLQIVSAPVKSLVAKWMGVAHGLRSLGDDKAAEATDECAAELAEAIKEEEPTTAAGLVDGEAITGYTVEDHEDWFTDPGDAAEMLREYADAKAGSEFYLTPWHQLPRQTLRITGPEYEDYEVEAAIGREVTK